MFKQFRNQYLSINPKRVYAGENVRICHGCNYVYDSDAEYCNLCEVELNDTNSTTRFRENPHSNRLKSISNYFAIATIFFLVLGFFLFKGFLLLATILYIQHIAYYKKAKLKSQVPAEELLQNDLRRPVLFLRSFKRDGASVYRQRLLSIRTLVLITTQVDIQPFVDIESFEERLAEILFQLGPAIAINDPRNDGKFVDVGVARMNCGKEWPNVIEDLCQRASYIVLMLDTTEGVMWETSVVFHMKDKIRLFIVPPVEGLWVKRPFKNSYNILQKQLTFLPNYQTNLVGVLFPAGSSKAKSLISTEKKPPPKERLLIIEETILALIPQ